MSIIRDASSGTAAKIDSEGSLLTTAVERPIIMHNSMNGDTFLISSGFVTSSATADDSRAIMYVKNTSTTKRMFLGFMTVGSEVPGKFLISKNPTSISNSTALTPANLNFTDATTLDATAEVGGATSDTTGGTEIMHWMQGGPSVFASHYRGSIILGPNDSIAVEFAPFSAAAGEVSLDLLAWTD